MTLISKLLATFHGDGSKKGKKRQVSFHRQQLQEMKRFNQPLISGWR